MKKLLKFIGKVLAFICLLASFLWAMANKVWSIPILLGFLGICIFVLFFVDTRDEWKKRTIIGITGVLFIFTSGYLLCKNCHVTDPIVDVFFFGAFISLFIEGASFCIIIIQKCIDKLKH